ncbi:MAG: Crp/Fnr family transcriptional regulator [Hyphomicrobiales bacterium]
MSANMIDRFISSGGRTRKLGAGEYLFHLGEPVLSLFVVLEGEVHLVRHQELGGAIILQRAGPGEVLAEAPLFSDRYHCDAVTEKGATVRSTSKRELRKRLRNGPDFAEAWAAHLAREIQNTRLRSEILSLKTVASRLDAWLAWNGELPPKGEWAHLANEIGVSPEALYREIAKRRN